MGKYPGYAAVITKPVSAPVAGPCHTPAHRGSIKSDSKILCLLAHHEVGLCPLTLTPGLVTEKQDIAEAMPAHQKRAGIHSSECQPNHSRELCLHRPVMLQPQTGRWEAHGPGYTKHRWSIPPGNARETHNCLGRDPLRTHMPQRSHPHRCPKPWPNSASPTFSDPCSHLHLSKMCLSVVSTHLWGSPHAVHSSKGVPTIFLLRLLTQ